MSEIQIKVKIDGVEYSQEQLAELAAKGKEAGKSMDDLKKKQKEAGEEATVFSEAKKKFEDATKGVKTIITSMKTLKGAIAATGIGLLVLALGSLLAYFTSTEEGSRKLAIATEALGIVFGKITELGASLGEKLVWIFENPKQALLDFANLIKENIVNRFEGLLELLPKLGEAIGKLFKGDFSGAAKIATDAVGKVALGVESITDTVSDLAAGAVEVFNTIVAETEKAVAAATKLVDATRALRDQQQKLVVDNAKLNQELEIQQKIAEDTTLAYADRKAALEKVGAAQIALAANVAAQTKNEEELIKLQIAQESNYEKREELETQLAEATAARIEAQTALGIKEQEVAKITRELDLEELERKRSITDMVNDLRKSTLDNQIEVAQLELALAEENALRELETLRATEEEKQLVRDYYAQLRTDLESSTQDKIKEILDEAGMTLPEDIWEQAYMELDIQQQKQLMELDSLKASEADKQKLIESYGKKREKLAKEEAEYDKALKKEAAQANLQVASDALKAISGLVGENTKAGKIAAIAATTIDTYMAAQKAYTSQLLPGDPTSPVRAAIAAGVAIATGIANVQKIIATPTPGAGGGGGGGGSAPSKPNIPSFNATQNTGSLALGFDQGPNAGNSSAIDDVRATAATGSANQPIVKTYVVATEMTEAQEKNKRIEDIAKL